MPEVRKSLLEFGTESEEVNPGEFATFVRALPITWRDWFDPNKQYAHGYESIDYLYMEFNSFIVKEARRVLPPGTEFCIHIVQPDVRDPSRHRGYIGWQYPAQPGQIKYRA